MLHWYASETVAAILWAAFLLLALLARVCFPSWLSARSSLELLTIVVSCCYGARLIARGKPCQWPRGVDFTGRVALVTGASSGVGYACAEELALHGFTVIMAGHHLDRLLTARQRIQQKVAEQQRRQQKRSRGPALSSAGSAGSNGQNDKIKAKNEISGGGRVIVLGKVDLSDEESIRGYAGTVTAAAKYYPVSLLINAAGILNRELRYTQSSWPATLPAATAASASPPPPDRATTAGNIATATATAKAARPLEEMLATNAVGPMLLTQLLLPVLKDTAIASGVTSRIVNVASSCHTFLGPSLSGSAAYDPIQMIAGLEKQSDKGAEPGGAGLSATRSAESLYDIDRFCWSTFVGYYGLSKLCVVWNTRLLARQVASMTFATAPKMTPTQTSQPAQQQQRSGAPSPSSPRGEQMVFIACSHPGVVTTHLYRDLLPQWALDYAIYWPSLLIGKTWREAAQSTLKAAVENADMAQGGYYLDSGEYGEQSGVNCLSAHASNVEEMMRYGEWLKEKIVDTTPRPYTAVSAKELNASSAFLKAVSESK